MKTITKYFLTGMILSFHISAFGQFNTLTPAFPKKTEEKIIPKKIKETDDKKQKNNKNFWKDIFNGTTKADLKNELDSLKTLLKENSSADNKKWNRQKMQERLFEIRERILMLFFIRIESVHQIPLILSERRLDSLENISLKMDLQNKQQENMQI